MSSQGIERVLVRATSDKAFVKALFADAEKTLAGFDLTAEEVKTFKEMSMSELNTLAEASPEERKSFWVILNHNEKTLRISR